MTFDEWWKIIKPAECDELKEYFNEAYQLGFSHGYKKGVAAFHDAVKFERKECAAACQSVANSGPSHLWGDAANECARIITKRSNVEVKAAGACASPATEGSEP